MREIALFSGKIYTPETNFTRPLVVTNLNSAHRLVPRLPPAKLMANVVAVSSDFIGERKNALVRWLTIVASHPVVGDDQMVRFFMTDMMNDHANSLREQFRFFPDEFVMNEMGAQVEKKRISCSF